MKLHDLRPAPGSRVERVRVGRGIAAGKGKTAGRGTKGQKARAGGSIAPFFEGGQTPLPQRVPKLHGFKNRFRVEYAVVNVGRICEAVEAGRFGQPVAAGAAPVMVNPELLRAAGLIGTLRQPVKVLGQGDVNVRLFVLADAFTASARAKIEGAGGTAQVIEVADDGPTEGSPEPAAQTAPSLLEPVAEGPAEAVVSVSADETKTPVRRASRKSASAGSAGTEPSAPSDRPATETE